MRGKSGTNLEGMWPLYESTQSIHVVCVLFFFFFSESAFHRGLDGNPKKHLSAILGGPIHN